jgi:DNA-binding MarR family transcriptional regulator
VSVTHNEVASQYERGLGLLLQLALVLHHDLAQSLARDGLTVSRVRVLWELRARGPVLQRELADALDVAPRTMTGIVDGLVATDFVTRQPHPTDRRAALVTLTPRGEATIAAMEADQARFVEILFGGMSEERLACLIDGLEEVLARLRQHGLQLPSASEEESA